MRQVFSFVQKFLVLLIGTAGFRFDVAATLPVWLAVAWALWILGITLSSYAIGRGPHGQAQCIVAIVVGWAAYYLGNTLLLTSLNKRLVKAYGEEVAWQIYAVVIGTLFALQGLGFSASSQLQFLPMFSDAPPDAQTIFDLSNNAEIKTVLIVAVAVVFLIGFASKMAATWVAGLDTYYYKDMFLDRDLGTGFVASGIYSFSWIKSPMYGLGNLHTYALATVSGYWPGIIVSAVFQASIFVFDAFVEQPFVRRTYGGHQAATGGGTAQFEKI